MIDPGSANALVGALLIRTLKPMSSTTGRPIRFPDRFDQMQARLEAEMSVEGGEDIPNASGARFVRCAHGIDTLVAFVGACWCFDQNWSWSLVRWWRHGLQWEVGA